MLNMQKNNGTPIIETDKERIMKEHDLKTDHKVFEWSMNVVKDYEILFNDRDFRVGDDFEPSSTGYHHVVVKGF